MFLFVVRHLRWLARVPGAPQLFDALLLAWTSLFHRKRLAAMEALERAVLQTSPDVRLRVHRFGGVEFSLGKRELGHLHGHGLLDVWVGRAEAARLLRAGAVRPHHVLPDSGWVSFQLESLADVPRALALLTERAAPILRDSATAA